MARYPIVARVLDLVLFCIQDTLSLAGGCIAFKAECAQAKVSCLQGFVQPLGRMRAGAKLSCINVQFVNSRLVKEIFGPRARK